MNQTFQNPPARLWCLYGLTGMVLMAGVLLEEGQARTYSPSQAIDSLQVKELNLTTHSSETTNAGKQPLKSSREQKSEDPPTHKQAVDKKSTKKMMGLTILFLGILAEEG